MFLLPASKNDSTRSAQALRYVLLILLVEKVIQHIVVSFAFYFDWMNIAATVVVDPKVLLVLGMLLVILYCIAFWGIAIRRRWAANLVLVLALFDIVGEFVAQGTLAITINVSFLVAIALFLLTLLYRGRVSTGRREVA
jgi:hypothetical protein